MLLEAPRARPGRGGLKGFGGRPSGERVSNSNGRRLEEDAALKSPPRKRGGLEIEEPFVRGDGNGDGGIDIADAILILHYLFTDGSVPLSVAALDSNADGNVDISDAIFLLTYLFLSGPQPPEPFFREPPHQNSWVRRGSRKSQALGREQFLTSPSSLGIRMAHRHLASRPSMEANSRYPAVHVRGGAWRARHDRLETSALRTLRFDPLILERTLPGRAGGGDHHHL